MALPECDPLAQTVEHLTFNQGVRSSSLRWITKKELNRFFRFSSFLSKTEGLGMKSTPLTLHGIAAYPRMASAGRLYFFDFNSMLAVR